MSRTIPQERYRSITTAFWSDPKVSQSFTAIDCLVFLYLITNLHGNLSGCFEVSINDICHETKLKQDQITKSIKHLEELDVIRTDPNTNEILILNFYRYNWGNSSTVKTGVLKIAKHIKSDTFRDYVLSLCDANADRVSIPYVYPIDNLCISTVTDTDTETVTDTVLLSDKPKKKKYGEYKHVSLSDDQLEKLKAELPNKWEQRIKAVDEYCEQKGVSYKNYYLVIKRWTDYPNTNSNTEERTYNTNNLKEMFKKW